MPFFLVQPTPLSNRGFRENVERNYTLRCAVTEVCETRRAWFSDETDILYRLKALIRADSIPHISTSSTHSYIRETPKTKDIEIDNLFRRKQRWLDLGHSSGEFALIRKHSVHLIFLCVEFVISFCIFNIGLRTPPQRKPGYLMGLKSAASVTSWKFELVSDFKALHIKPLTHVHLEILEFCLSFTSVTYFSITSKCAFLGIEWKMACKLSSEFILCTKLEIKLILSCK